jgi:hypothetical protein
VRRLAALALLLCSAGCGGESRGAETGPDAARIATEFVEHLFAGRGDEAAGMIASGASVPAHPFTADLASDLRQRGYRRTGPARRDRDALVVPYVSAYTSARSGEVCEVGAIRVVLTRDGDDLRVDRYDVTPESLRFGTPAPGTRCPEGTSDASP